MLCRLRPPICLSVTYLTAAIGAVDQSGLATKSIEFASCALLIDLTPSFFHHFIKTKLEIAIDSGCGQKVSPQPAKTSTVTGSMQQSSNLSGASPKNGSHSCPTANASESGRGTPRGKNPLNDVRSQSSRQNSLSRFNQSMDHPALEK